MACALRILYDQALAHIVHVRTDEPRHSSLDYSLILLTHFLLIEITAMFERIANYGQTGNARVLMPTIMDPLQLTVVARKGMLPYFGPSIKFNENNGPLSITFTADHWPTNLLTKSPLMASLASIKFHYGKAYCQVRHQYFTRSTITTSSAIGEPSHTFRSATNVIFPITHSFAIG